MDSARSISACTWTSFSHSLRIQPTASRIARISSSEPALRVSQATMRSKSVGMAVRIRAGDVACQTHELRPDRPASYLH